MSDGPSLSGGNLRPNPIARFAVTRRVAVSMMATAIIVLGIFAIPRLAISLLPSFSPPIINVSVNYPNVGPEQIETLITRPIENAVSRVPGIDYIESTSSEGNSRVRAQFHFGVNIDTAAVDVQQQVDRIRSQLPNDPTLQTPQISKFDPNSLPVVTAYVTDPTRSQRDLNDIFTNQLADEFSAIIGVGSVTVNASQTRAIMIEPNANVLAGYNLTADQLVARIAAENVNLPAGIIQIAQNAYQIQTNALYQNEQQIANTIVTTKNGAPIFVRDVAKVTDSIEEQLSYTRLNGEPAISLSITAQPDANVVGVARGVYSKIDDIKKRFPSMQFGVLFDQRGFIIQSINALEHTAIYGAMLAVLVILLFLHSWRSTLIVAISLPISILGTLFAAYMFGYSLNTMTLGGLALAVGLIVDDAIVVIENIYRHYMRGETIVQAAQNAVTQIFSAVLASSITVITVFVPLLLIPGLQGLLFTPFALMVMCAVGISLLVAVTTVPMLATRLWAPQAPKPNGSPKGPYARFSAAFDRRYERFANAYRRLLAWSLDHPGPVLGTAAAILVVTLLVVKFGAVATEIFPATNSRFANFTLRMPTGTALNVTDAMTKDVEARLRKDKRVVDVGASVGSGGGFSGTRVITNQSTVQVTLQPNTSSADAGRFVAMWQNGLMGQRTGGASGGSAAGGSPPGSGRNTMSPERRAQLRAIVGSPIPGLAVFGRTNDIISRILSQGQDELSIMVYGPDLATLDKLAHQALPGLADIPGISRPDTNVTQAQPQLNIQVDRVRAASLGLSTMQVSQAIATATSGSIASYLQINGTQVPIIVQLPANQRRSYTSVADLALSVPTTTGGNGLLVNTPATPGTSYTLQTIPLTSVANVSLGSGPSQTTRLNKQRELEITASLNGATLGNVTSAAAVVMNKVAMPAGYHWEFGPGINQQTSTFSSLGLIVILAIALIYMLLAAQFESLLHPLIIMMSVPLSVAGVVFALLITHRAFGLTAFIGVLMLVGIVVKNAILVVEFTNQLRRQGSDPRAALMEAAPIRLRPIVMTTLATIGGMTPIAIGLEAGSQTQAPLGTVVIGGLLCSTMLSLVVIPTLYLWVAKHIEPRFAPKIAAPEPRRKAVPQPEPVATI
ncbi:MAG: efflux RND transporter permease subunit [Candidatus Eremiobacteraeota bacterium]|nr:efflux RND transporter permease subunit [Candidatus Eremiobacteraeota bacterium]